MTYKIQSADEKRKVQHKILIIDDEPDQVDFIKIRLEANSYKCLIAASPVDGLGALEAWQPDLILLDLNMPKMSGYGTLQQIKHHPTCANVPVIILSSIGDKEIIRGALDFGAAGYLRKTCSHEEMMSIIRKCTHVKD